MLSALRDLPLIPGSTPSQGGVIRSQNPLESRTRNAAASTRKRSVRRATLSPQKAGMSTRNPRAAGVRRQERRGGHTQDLTAQAALTSSNVLVHPRKGTMCPPGGGPSAPVGAAIALTRTRRPTAAHGVTSRVTREMGGLAPPIDPPSGIRGAEKRLPPDSLTWSASRPTLTMGSGTHRQGRTSPVQGPRV